MRRGKYGTLFHSNRDLANWRQTVMYAALEASQGSDGLPSGPVAVSLAFRVPRPATARRSLPHVRPDIDKLARAILDALTGVVYGDDGQVVDLVVSKRYADDIGVTVEVTVVP